MPTPTQIQSQNPKRALTEISQAFARDGKPSMRGWWWAALTLLGLIGVIVVGQWSQAERLSIGRTATVIAEAQSAMQMLSSKSEASERGEPGALGQLRQARASMDAFITVLKRGGSAAAGDPVPVMQLGGKSDIPLPAVEQALGQFDQASTILVENGALLERAGAAERAFGPALLQAAASVQVLASQPSFAQGPWQQGVAPLRQEWTRPELQTMTIVFAPLDGAVDLQQQWAQRFKAQAADTNRLLGLANRDPRVSPADREKLTTFAQTIDTIAASAATLAEATPVRVRVAQARAAWKAPLASGQAELDKAGSVVFAMAKGRGIGTYLTWVLGVLGLLGAVMLTREWMLNQKAAVMVSQESVVVQHGQEQIDHVIRQLRKIVPGDAPIQRGTRLHEEPESSAFPLAQMINRLLDTFDSAEEEIKHQASEIDLTLATGLEAGTNLATQAQRHRQSLSQVEASVLALANQAANLEKRGSLLQQGLDQCAESVKATSSALQQGMFKGEAVRENTQDAAKRIKRLSESAQAISLAVDLIYGVIQQVQVLSLNVAIEAANAGEQGRNFVVISQEIQRLVTKGTSAAQQIDKSIETILTDAKDTVSAMEQGTMEVVESGKLTARAMAALREAEKEVSSVMSDIPKLTRDLAQQAYSSVAISEQVQAVDNNMKQAATDAGRAQAAFGEARSKAGAIVRFIEQAGSRTLWRRGSE